jgi:hypothetical protein
VAHADRDSIAAAVLVARDLRMIDGFWVYPQQDLMTFFRGVATDLRPDTPIYVIGFTAKPTRDVLQAASLYAGRLTWLDHHEWPPEDLWRCARRSAPTTWRSWGWELAAAVIAQRTRRSRF